MSGLKLPRFLAGGDHALRVGKHSRQVFSDSCNSAKRCSVWESLRISSRIDSFLGLGHGRFISKRENETRAECPCHLIPRAQRKGVHGHTDVSRTKSRDTSRQLIMLTVPLAAPLIQTTRAVYAFLARRSWSRRSSPLRIRPTLLPRQTISAENARRNSSTSASSSSKAGEKLGHDVVDNKFPTVGMVASVCVADRSVSAGRRTCSCAGGHGGSAAARLLLGRIAPSALGDQRATAGGAVRDRLFLNFSVTRSSAEFQLERRGRSSRPNCAPPGGGDGSACARTAAMRSWSDCAPGCAMMLKPTGRGFAGAFADR